MVVSVCVVSPSISLNSPAHSLFLFRIDSASIEVELFLRNRSRLDSIQRSFRLLFRIVLTLKCSVLLQDCYTPGEGNNSRFFGFLLVESFRTRIASAHSCCFGSLPLSQELMLLV
jgi:hypothetical protein